MAIFFVSDSTDPTELKGKKSLIFLPISIFLLSGFTDSLSQWCSETKVLEGEQNHFAWLVFGGAAVSSSLLIVAQTLKGKVDWAWKSVLGGITLGLPNYASYLFLLQTLDSFDHQGDFVFPIANLGVILISSLMSFGLFSDKITGRQWLGLAVSAVSLALISSKSWL
jgi:drug/metabolite transporter (DMT)-like permease